MAVVGGSTVTTDFVSFYKWSHLKWPLIVISVHPRLHDLTDCVCYKFFELQTTQDSETLLTAGKCGIVV